MKKIWGTALTVFTCLCVLSGCGGGNTETVSDSTVTSAEIASEISETTTAETTTATVSETETTAEMEQERELPYEIIDMNNYTGNFYEWKYDYDIVAYDRESFAGGEDILAAAEKVLEDKGDLRFKEGVYEDFDGDGKKESFICFGLINPDSFSGELCYVVFVDSEENAELLPQASGEAFDGKQMLNPIRYNGFIHMCTAFGVNNSTHHSEIYAVENGKAVHKKSMFSPSDPFCGAFMLESAPQAPGSWISFWNEETGEYSTLATEDTSDEEIQELINSEAFKQNERLSEIESDELRFRVAGKKFYGVFSKDWDCGYFERTANEFKSSEYSIIFPQYDNEVYAVGIDINKAQSEMIRLEK